jgi:hypothetical protein
MFFIKEKLLRFIFHARPYKLIFINNFIALQLVLNALMQLKTKK